MENITTKEKEEEKYFSSKEEAEEEDINDSGFVTGGSVSIATPTSVEKMDLNDEAFEKQINVDLDFDVSASKELSSNNCEINQSGGENDQSTSTKNSDNKSDSEICDGVVGKCKINAQNDEVKSLFKRPRHKINPKNLREKLNQEENVELEESLPSDAKKQKQEKQTNAKEKENKGSNEETSLINDKDSDLDNSSNSEDQHDTEHLFSDWTDDDSEEEEKEEEAEEEKPKKSKEEIEEEDRIWLEKDVDKLPKINWRVLRELKGREMGFKQHNWTYRVRGARAMVKRLELMWTMDKHEGCVNAINFNQTGTLLASGSDDLKVILWDWCSKGGYPVVTYDSGHRSNVFQAKFMPDCGDSTVVSSARDGEVRVADISSTGTCKGTKKVAQHRGSAHKLSLDPGSRSTLLSCGEDGVVMGIDLRQKKSSEKLVTVKSGIRKIPLYSIHNNPLISNQFAVSGRDQFARVFDVRMLTETDGNTEPVKTFCPDRLKNASGDAKVNITCLMYNWCGSELLCSYNDDDIYLFDVSHSSGAEYIKRYKGHRNNVTVKGVNFYGPRSQYIISGSDCGNIFFWEKQSAKIIHLKAGDEGGVVNALEPHPSLPVLATSGLDHNIKLWSPTGESFETCEEKTKIKETMIKNHRESVDERDNMPDMIDGHMLWFLMRSLRSRRTQSRRDEENNEDSSETNSSDSDEESQQPSCNQS